MYIQTIFLLFRIVRITDVFLFLVDVGITAIQKCERREKNVSFSDFY